jgi:hypothetical protein
MLGRVYAKTQELPASTAGHEGMPILSGTIHARGEKGVHAMETGTKEAGCVYLEREGATCHKLTENGTSMCPHHNMLVKYKEQARQERLDKAKKQKTTQKLRGKK